MQKIMDDLLSGDKIVIDTLAQLVIAKLQAQGANGVEAHFDWIRSELGKRHRNEDGLTWEHPLRVDLDGMLGDYSVSFDSKDLDHLSQKVDNAVVASTNEATDAFFSLILQDIRQQASETLGRRAEEVGGFRRRLASRWARPLQLLALQLEISIQFGRDMSEWLRLKATNSDAALVEALLRLHARACQIAGEVEVLLQSGFADGALSRWRSLHEVATVALFLQKQGNDVAQRYLDHLAVDSCDLARKIRAASENPNSGISEKEMDRLLSEVKELKIQYGADFAEEYGWASDALNNRKPNFSQIEKAVSLEKWRPYYKLASATVHAGPKGSYWKLGLLNHQDLLLAGPSNAGLAEAGRLTAISLTHVSAAIMLRHTVIDTVVWPRVIFKLSGEVEEAFLTAASELERAEESTFSLVKRPEKISSRLRRRQGK